MSHLNAIAVALLLALTPLATTADPLADAVKLAVAARKLHDSDLKGSAAAPTPYREVAADGGVLVGLEVGLGGPKTNERVIAIRPVYRTGGRERTGSPAGHFLSDEVTRTIRPIARDGYAVAGLTVSAGRNVNGLAVRFARTAGAWLDQADTYESDWVGKGDKRESIDGEGRPVVGLFGRVDGDAVVGFGLIYADLPRPEPKTSATATATAPAATPETDTDTASESRATGLLPVIIFGAVAVPIGVLGVIAFRRKPEGIQHRPRVTARVNTLAPPEPESIPPPSIPGDVPSTVSTVPGSRWSLQAVVEMEMDCLRN